MNLLLLTSAVLAAVSAQDTCTLIDWWEHKNDVNIVGTQLTTLLHQSPVLGLLQKMDPHTVDGDLLEQLGMEINHTFIYDFNVEVKFNHLKIAGHSGLKLIPIEAVNSKELRFALEFDELVISGQATAILNQLTQTGCADDEESHGGLCYKKCSILTGGSFPLRTAANTCSTNGCSPDRELHQTICYIPCREYYIGVGPICWGRCDKLVGEDYRDTGLTCHRLWPPHAVGKPHYNRGIGVLPYKPWTNGFGCNGFGVNRDGGCATPYWRICFTERLQIKGEGDCQPGQLTGDFNIHLKKPRLETTIRTEIPVCQDGGEEGDELHKNVACVARAMIYIALGAVDPEQSGSVLENFAKFKAMIARIQFEDIRLTYEKSSVLDINIKGKGFVGWVISFVHNFLKLNLNRYQTLIGNLINKQLLNTLLKNSANKAIDAELQSNACRN